MLWMTTHLWRVRSTESANRKPLSMSEYPAPASSNRPFAAQATVPSVKLQKLLKKPHLKSPVWDSSERLDVPFGIVDLSLAPTPAVGDSVARIIEEVGLETCGGCGTTAILAMLNDAVKKGGVMASSNVGGLSGAFIPVSEDEGMIAAAQSGVLTMQKLEAMTAVCSVGIDMVAVPGDTSAEVISGLIADEIAIGVVNTKTTAVRVIPAVGKKVGDSVEFGGLLGAAPIMPVPTQSPARFIHRGGRIPAPIHSLKN